MNWFPNQCRRFRQSLSLLAGGALPARERDEVERHLADCADCHRHYEQIKNLTASLADYRNSVAGLEPTPAARQQWARAIRAASQPEGASRDNREQSTARWWHEVFGRGRSAWVGIAVLWIVMWAVNWGRPGSDASTGAGSALAPVITQTFEEQQRLLAELIPPSDREPAATPRRKRSPRSEGQRPWLVG